MTPLKTVRVTSEREMRSAAASRRHRLLHPMARRSLHRSTTGVTTMAPTTSPSHHVDQIGPKRAHSANPARDRVVTPTVALIVDVVAGRRGGGHRRHARRAPVEGKI